VSSRSRRCTPPSHPSTPGSGSGWPRRCRATGSTHPACGSSTRSTPTWSSTSTRRTPRPRRRPSPPSWAIGGRASSRAVPASGGSRSSSTRRASVTGPARDGWSRCRGEGWRSTASRRSFAGEVPAGEVRLGLLVATDAEAEQALWQHVTDIDLTTMVTTRLRPLDDPLPWMVHDRLRLGASACAPLYVRLLDVARCLASRTSSVTDGLVLEVHDHDRDQSGRYRWDVSPEGSACSRTDVEPDLDADGRSAGRVWLGGSSPSQLHAARRLEERTTGAVARLGRMTATEHAPLDALGVLTSYRVSPRSASRPKATMWATCTRRSSWWARAARASTTPSAAPSARPARAIRNLDWFEVKEIRGWIKDGEPQHTQVTLEVGFRLEDEPTGSKRHPRVGRGPTQRLSRIATILGCSSRDTVPTGRVLVALLTASTGRGDRSTPWRGPRTVAGRRPPRAVRRDPHGRTHARDRGHLGTGWTLRCRAHGSSSGRSRSRCAGLRERPGSPAPSPLAHPARHDRPTTAAEEGPPDGDTPLHRRDHAR
jgi:flavin-binding protein dodecin